MKRLAALVLALLPACASTGDYLHDRGADLVDVVRGHLIVGKAIGVEAQVTRWLGVGFVHEENAWAGGLHNRELGTWTESVDALGFFIHDWKESTKGIPELSGSYGWYRKARQDGPSFTGTGSTLDFFTVRGTVALLVGVDLEVRLGEAFDFLVGILTFDPAGDDG
jgi:hypothetical protein